MANVGNCEYSVKFKPLLEAKKNDPDFKEWVQKFFKNPDTVIAEFLGDTKPSEGFSTKDVKKENTRRRIAEIPTTSNYSAYFFGNVSALFNMEKKFTINMAKFSLLDIDINGKQISNVTWINPNASPIDSDSPAQNRLNDSILDYKIKLAKRLYEVSKTTPKNNVIRTDEDLAIYINDAIKNYSNYLLQDDSTQSDLNYETFVILKNFDSLVLSKTPFIKIKDAYKKAEGINKYEYVGPFVQHYTGFTSDESAAIEKQDSKLSKILLDLIPEIDASGNIIVLSDDAINGISYKTIGLAGFNSIMTSLKSELAYSQDDEYVKLREQYFNSGLEFDVNKAISVFLTKSLRTTKSKKNKSVYSDHSTYLLNKLRGLQQFVFNGSKTNEQSQFVKNMFGAMFRKTEKINYRAYMLKRDSGFSGVDLQTNFVDSQKGTLNTSLRAAVYTWQTESGRRNLEQLYDITVEPNGSSVTIKSNDGAQELQLFRTYKGWTYTLNGSIDFAKDILAKVLYQIIPDEYDVVLDRVPETSFLDDFKNILGNSFLTIYNIGQPLLNKDGRIDFIASSNEDLNAIATRLSIIRGAETKNVVKDPKGNKIPMYQLTSLNYNVRMMMNDFSKDPNSIYKDNAIVKYPGLLKQSFIRNAVSINGKIKEASKLSVAELMNIEVLNDFYGAFFGKESSGTIYLQNATFADKSTHFLQQYDLNITVRINGQNVLLKEIVQKAIQGENTAQQQLIDLMYQHRKAKIDRVVSNIKSDYSQVYDKKFNSLKEIQDYLRDNHKSYNGVVADFKEKGIEFREEIHLTAKTPAESKLGYAQLNEVIVNQYNTLSNKTNFQKRLDRNKSRFIDQLTKNGVKWNKWEISSINGIKHKFDNNENWKPFFKSYNFNGNISLIEDGKMNPLLETYFLMDCFLSNEFNSCILGEVYAHPSKNKTYSDNFEEYAEWSEASRLIAQIKRSVIPGATVHPYQQHVLDHNHVDIGVPEQIRIAVMKDMPANVFTLLGDHSEKLDSMDGSGLSSPYMAIMENNSLIDAKVGWNKKSIMADLSSKYGDPVLLKWAVYALTNEVRRNGLMSKASSETLFKNMHNMDFGDQTQHIIEFLTEHLKNNEYIGYYDYKTGTHVRMTGIDDTTILYDNGMKVDASQIHTIYEFDQLLGGCWSETFNEETNEYSYSNQTNLKLGSYFICKYNLKDKMIAYAVNKSAIKVGAGNINSEDAWYGDTKLNTISMSTKYGGIQMDADHELDMAEVTEMTQMLSALSQDGYYAPIVNEIYQEIGDTVFNDLEDLRQAVAQYNLDEAQRNKVYTVLAKILFESFGQDTDDIGLAQAFIKKAERAMQALGKEIETPEFKVPFSAATINGKFIASVISKINKSGIRHKYEGFAGVLNPSYNMIQYFRTDVGDTAVRMLPQFAEFCRQQGMTVEEAITDNSFEIDPTTNLPIFKNKFIRKAKYINGVVDLNDIDFEDTVLLYNNIDHTLEEVYINNWKTYDTVKHLQSLSGYTIYKWTSKPKNLKQANTRFTVKDVKGQSYTFSLYDTDEVRASYYIKEINKNNVASFDSSKLNIIQRVLGYDRDFFINYFKYNKEADPNWLKSIEGSIRELCRKLDKKEAFYGSIVMQQYGLADICIASEVITTAAECIAGKYHAKQFGLKNGDQISDIKNSDFFYNRLANKYNSVENITAKLKEKFDNAEDLYDCLLYHDGEEFLVKIADKEESEALPAQFDGVISDYTDIQLINKKLWYNNEFISSSTGKQIYTITIDNKKKNIIVVNSIEEFNKLKNSNFFDRYKQYNWTEKNKKTLLEAKYKNDTELRLQNNESLERIFYKHKNIVTLNELRINEQITRMQRLKQVAENQYTAFKRQLNYIGTRIPSQGMQSFMPMNIIAFTDSDTNEIYVPAIQTYLQGSDYDIDKVYVLAYSIDQNGFLQTGSRLSKYYPDSVVLKLVKPNGVHYEEANIESPNDTVISIKELKIATAETLKYKTKEGWVNLSPEFVAIYNKVFRSPSAFIRFEAPTKKNDIAEFIWMKNRFLSNLNLHSQTKMTPEERIDCLRNKIVNKIIDINKSVQNQLSAHMPISMDEQQEAAKKSSLSKDEKTLSSDNPAAKFLMQQQNSVGKECIGIVAVALKGFFALSAYYNNQIVEAAKKLAITGDVAVLNNVGLTNLAQPILNNLNYQPIIDVLSRMQTSEAQQELLKYETAKQITRQNDSALSLSGLLSAATDNAKELILSKINATPDLIDIYCYYIDKGWNFAEIARRMQSRAFNMVVKLGEENVFNVGTYGYKVKKLIPVLLGTKLLPNTDRKILASVIQEYTGTTATKTGELINLCFNDSEAVKKCIEGLEQLQEEKYEQWLQLKNLKRDADAFALYLDEQQERAAEEADRKAESYDNIDDDADVVDLIEVSKLSFAEINTIIEQLRKYLDINAFWKAEQQQIGNEGLELNALPEYKQLAQINKDLAGVEEISLIGRLLGINQGIKTNVHDLNTFLTGLESFVNERVGTIKDVPPFDAATFMKKFALEPNSAYVSQWIKRLQDTKGGVYDFNVLEIITHVPHYAEMFKALGITYSALEATSAKFRQTMQLAKIMDGYPSQQDFSAIGSYLNDLYIFNYLKNSNFKILVPKGETFYRDQLGRTALNLIGLSEEEKNQFKENPNSKLVTPMYVELNTPQGLATFKHLMDSYIIPKLKRKYSKNAFVTGLQPYEDILPDGTHITGYKFPINITDASKDSTTEIIYQQYLNGFMEIYKNEALQWKIGDLFYLYNMLINKDSFGEKSFTRIFEDIVASEEVTPLIDGFNRYVSQLDDGTIEMPITNKLAQEAAYRCAKYSKGTNIKSSIKFDEFAKLSDFTLDLPLTQEQELWKGSLSSELTVFGSTNLDLDKRRSLLYSIVNELKNKGANIELVSKDELADLDPNRMASKAFILNGTIYINVEQASVATVIHELSHLICAAWKFDSDKKRRAAYYNNLNEVSKLPEFKKWLATNPYVKDGQSLVVGSDLQEEYFAYLLEKTLMGYNTELEGILRTMSGNVITNVFTTLKESKDIKQTAEIKTIEAILEVFNTNLEESDKSAISYAIQTSTQVASVKTELYNKDKLNMKCS